MTELYKSSQQRQHVTIGVPDLMGHHASRDKMLHDSLLHIANKRGSKKNKPPFTLIHVTSHTIATVQKHHACAKGPTTYLLLGDRLQQSCWYKETPRQERKQDVIRPANTSYMNAKLDCHNASSHGRSGCIVVNAVPGRPEAVACQRSPQQGRQCLQTHISIRLEAAENVTT